MSMQNFQGLIASLGPDIVLSGESCFDLLFREEDVASTTYLTHDGRRVATDMIVEDLSGMNATRRRALMHHILLVNDLMARNGDYRLGVDFRKLLVLTGEFNIREYDYDVFPNLLVAWVQQVRALREVVDAFMRNS